MYLLFFVWWVSTKTDRGTRFRDKASNVLKEYIRELLNTHNISPATTPRPSLIRIL